VGQCPFTYSYWSNESYRSYPCHPPLGNEHEDEQEHEEDADWPCPLLTPRFLLLAPPPICAVLKTGAKYRPHVVVSSGI
jgi:hypothetical protein